jgi:hypothetical protein
MYDIKSMLEQQFLDLYQHDETFWPPGAFAGHTLGSFNLKNLIGAVLQN